MFKLKVPDFKKFLKKKQEKVIESDLKAESLKPGWKKEVLKKPVEENNKLFEHKKPKFDILKYFRRKGNEKESRIGFLKRELKKQEKKRAIVQERRHKLKFYLEKSGMNLDPSWLSKQFFNICIFINLVISAFLIYHFSTNFGITYTTIFVSIISVWVLVFILLLFALWVTFYLVVDLKIFKRKIDIEEVLPDFLQLTASNIMAGMTIDRSLWYAVKPRFGILAKEIEIVAKETMRGEDLTIALQKFADKYDSVLLKRSISLLIEGIVAGGEIGGLLNKIAINIQETRTLKKEMAANVTTYVIFISFATIAAAPVLFALSGSLIKVISTLGGSLGGDAASAGFALSFSSGGIQFSDFRIFAIVSLIITSFFSAIIIATIKKGSVKTGFKYIPIFILVTITLYLISDKVFGLLLSTFF